MTRSVKGSGIGHLVVICIDIAPRLPFIELCLILFVYILIYGDIRGKLCGIGELTVLIEPHKLIR